MFGANNLLIPLGCTEVAVCGCDRRNWILETRTTKARFRCQLALASPLIVCHRRQFYYPWHDRATRPPPQELEASESVYFSFYSILVANVTQCARQPLSSVAVGSLPLLLLSFQWATYCVQRSDYHYVSSATRPAPPTAPVFVMRRQTTTTEQAAQHQTSV